MLKILWAKISKVDIDHIIESSDASTLERIRGCVRPRKGQEIALGRFLARMIVSEAESIAMDEVMILHRNDGKPYVKIPDYKTPIGHSEGKPDVKTVDIHIPTSHSEGKPYVKNQDIHISISHSDGTCVAALSDVPVGCDIQSKRRFGGEAVKGFFTEEEYHHLESSEDSEAAMTTLWCIREAMIKLKGKQILNNRISLIEKETVESHYGVSLEITEIDGKTFVIATDGGRESGITVNEYKPYQPLKS